MFRSKTILLVLALLAVLAIGSVKAESYSFSVFRPTDVTYNINIHSYYHNITSGEIRNYSVEGILSIISKDLDLNYVGWGFTINISMTEYENGNTTRDNVSIAIPPVLLANKVETRELHPTDVLVDLLQGKLGDSDLQTIAGKIYTASPVDSLYIYNVFFIPTDVKVGSKIPFGFVNKTGDSYVYNLEITGEDKVKIGDSNVDTWVIELSMETLKRIFNETGIDIDLDSDSEIEFILKMYYDKSTGWLTKVDVSANLNNSESGDIEYSFSGGLTMDKPPSEEVSKSYLNRVLGLPPFTMEAISIAAIVVLTIKMLRREK